MGLAFALYYLIPLWIAWFAYDFSSDGVVSEVAEATGALLIPALIATAVRVRGTRKTNLPFYVAVAVAGFGVLWGNQSRIKDAVDANAFKREMAGATVENYQDKLAHSQTQLGQMFYSVIQATNTSRAKLEQILLALDDESTADILTKETLLDRDKRSHAEQILKQKMASAKAALPQIEAVYSDLRKSAEKFSDIPDNIKRSFLVGFDESRAANEGLIKSYVINYEDLYGHLLAMLDILDANDGRFTIRADGKVIFTDNAAIAPYNQETASVQGDANNLEQIKTKMNAAHDAGIKKMIPTQ